MSNIAVNLQRKERKGKPLAQFVSRPFFIFYLLGGTSRQTWNILHQLWSNWAKPEQVPHAWEFRQKLEKLKLICQTNKQKKTHKKFLHQTQKQQEETKQKARTKPESTERGENCHLIMWLVIGSAGSERWLHQTVWNTEEGYLEYFSSQ